MATFTNAYPISNPVASYQNFAPNYYSSAAGELAAASTHAGFNWGGFGDVLYSPANQPGFLPTPTLTTPYNGVPTISGAGPIAPTVYPGGAGGFPGGAGPSYGGISTVIGQPGADNGTLLNPVKSAVYSRGAGYPIQSWPSPVINDESERIHGKFRRRHERTGFDFDWDSNPARGAVTPNLPYMGTSVAQTRSLTTRRPPHFGPGVPTYQDPRFGLNTTLPGRGHIAPPAPGYGAFPGGVTSRLAH